MIDQEKWYFDGSRRWAKILRFLNLLEDGSVKLSLTGLTLWVTTLQNLQIQIFSVDHITMALGAASNACGLVLHASKRWQEWRKK
jgi:hypothetical protein